MKNFFKTSVFLLVLVAGVSCATFNTKGNDREALLIEHFDLKHLDRPMESSLSVAGGIMNYLDTTDSNKPLVIFIHGSPGSSDDFIQYLGNETLRSQVRMIAIDRPGFGKSNPGKAVKSLAEQAAMIAPIIKHNKGEQPVYIAAHSFGGPVAAQIALDYPELVEGLILIAPCMSPELKETEWFQYVGKWPIFNSMIPTALDVANTEMMDCQVELEKQSLRWAEYHKRTILIHGDKDRLVSMKHSQYLAEKISHCETTYWEAPNADHYIPWKRTSLIKKAILELLTQQQAIARS